MLPLPRPETGEGTPGREQGSGVRGRGAIIIVCI